MYYSGQDVPQDYQEAIKWNRLAAEQGYASAQINLGLMYSAGQGMPQDSTEAAKWYRLAAEQGVPSAQKNLGLLYGSGQGVPRDYVLSYMWLNISTSITEGEEQIQIVELRESIAMFMSESQIAEARELSIKCISNKFKGC
jgi:hypothetical protein